MIIDDIALTLVNGVGPKVAIRLIECFGSAEAIFAATADQMIKIAELKPALATNIASKTTYRQAEKEIKFLNKNGYTAIAATSDQYPQQLKECADYPHVIYVNGNIDILNHRMLSIVGTRTPSSYGSVMCDRLVGDLAKMFPDLAIVSGLAEGVDINSHRAALYYGLATVAVMGTPLHTTYPSCHDRDAQRIVDNGGALITEMHSENGTTKMAFVVRNRIIAGLSAGTVVIQSQRNGGSLHTADFALGYDRSVMAVPGRANDITSSGTNQLIKSLKAQMVCSAWDIANELCWDTDTPKTDIEETKGAIYDSLSKDERGLLSCFKEGDIISTDQLSVISGLSISQMSALLFSLEDVGALKALTGNRYEKI